MSHPDPTREYGEHPEEPQHKEWLRAQGYTQGHIKAKVAKKMPGKGTQANKQKILKASHNKWMER